MTQLNVELQTGDSLVVHVAERRSLARAARPGSRARGRLGGGAQLRDRLRGARKPGRRGSPGGVRAAPLAGLLACIAMAGCGGEGNTNPAPRAGKSRCAGQRRAAHLHLRRHDRSRALRPLQDPEPRPRHPVRHLQQRLGGGREARRRLPGGRRGGLRRRDQPARRPQPPAPDRARTVFASLNHLAFSDAKGIRNAKRAGPVRPALGRASRADRQHRGGRPNPPDSCDGLFDPAYKGRVALEGDEALTPIGETRHGARHEGPDGPQPTQIARVQGYLEDHLDQFRSFAESDADMVNLFKSGEVVLADGGRGTALAGSQAGVPVKWIAPKEGRSPGSAGSGSPRTHRTSPPPTR